MNETPNGYVAVQGQINGGNGVEFYLTCNSDRQFFATAKKAIRHGLSHYGHDDFWIATVKDGNLVDLRWMEEERERDDEEWAAVECAIGTAKDAG